MVISPQPTYNWIPSNIWVGVGLMKKDQVLVALAPIYQRHEIEFKQARAIALYPEGDQADSRPSVEIEWTLEGKAVERERVPYDFLINATGPKLNFGATEGLGSGKNSLSVCSAEHAAETAVALQEAVARMKRGERQRFLVGTGHGGCTCEGAALEYVVNLEFELRARGVRDKADVVFLTNEYELGDLGIDGVHIRQGGYITPSRIFTESLFAERGIDWITKAHVHRVEPGQAHIETLDTGKRDVAFDFAMLLPPFTGVGLTAYGRTGEDILGHAWSWFWPGVPPGLFAVLGAAAVLAATTQGPISTVVLMMELTGRDRSFIVPLMLAVATATLVARTIEPRSIYDARLTDEEVAARRRLREFPAPTAHG